jgi:hypothetical protein
MKLPALVLATSVAFNVALVATFATKPHLAPAAVRKYIPGTIESASAAEAAAHAKAAQAAEKRAARAETKSASLWSRLQSEDLKTFAERLRAAGFPPATIRAIVDAELGHRFAPRLEELRRVMRETPYWRGDNPFYSGSNKLYESYSQINRERLRAVREVLGSDAYAFGTTDPTEAQRRQFGNLSPGKIEMVQRINDDYAEMISQVRASMQGITLPEDREKLALLEREKRADLAGILTPEELADYQMRSSNVTSRLRTALTIMDASEAEFRAIFQAHQAHAETLFPTAGSGVTYSSNDPANPRMVASRQIQEELTGTLGADRYAQFQRANDREFQMLYQLSRTDNLPYETVVRAYDTRSNASAASAKIMDDPALTPDAKRAALKDLAQQSRTQILSTLGQTAGPSYAKSAQWLNYLEQGRSFTVLPTGGISSRMVPTPRPATPPSNPTK